MSKNETSGQHDPSSQPIERDRFEFPNIPVKDQVSGKNHAEHVRHAIVRVAFLNYLIRDQRTQDLFDKWESNTKLMAAAQRFAALLTGAAQALKFESSEELLTALRRGEVSDLDTLEFVADDNPDNPIPALQVLVSAIEDYNRRCDLPTPSPDDARQFVLEELGLPWTWLASQLIQSFYMIAHAKLHGGEAGIHHSSDAKLAGILK